MSICAGRQRRQSGLDERWRPAVMAYFGWPLEMTNFEARPDGGPMPSYILCAWSIYVGFPRRNFLLHVRAQIAAALRHAGRISTWHFRKICAIWRPLIGRPRCRPRIGTSPPAKMQKFDWGTRERPLCYMTTLRCLSAVLGNAFHSA